MKKIIFIFLISFTFNLVHGQKITPTNKIDSITKNWDYKIYTDTQKLKIIEYCPAFAFCGRAIVYSMAICFNTSGDTIRIIEPCPGPKSFNHDEIVLFYPSQTIPKDKNPHLVYINGELNPILKKYKRVTITTYGQLQNQK